jgi:hypothetical protein
VRNPRKENEFVLLLLLLLLLLMLMRMLPPFRPNELQKVHPKLFHGNVSAFGHSVNKHLIIWGCFAKVKAHKKHWCTLNANPL